MKSRNLKILIERFYWSFKSVGPELKILGAMQNKVCLFLISMFFLTMSTHAMSYEEPKYKIIKKTDIYEVRRYEQRTVAQAKYDEEDSGFRILFDYISGENESATDVAMTIPVAQSTEINMTAPVTQTNTRGKMVMQFFLPKKYTKETAPRPKDGRIDIIDLPTTYYAVISYSGFASEKNFQTHHRKLKNALDESRITVSGPPIRATYNSPFTLPFFRRNEAMYPLDWD
ncbi:MAG TPA: SOUL heme-binding protein [Porticoccaceae bacterium]|nr:SOUL heme-binding protein [Porticoccaceae bacterium]